jgi:membrane-associated phospholipid phosphatase
MYLRCMTRRPKDLLFAALWCAVAFLALLAAAYGWSGARSLDARALHDFTNLGAFTLDGRVPWVGAFDTPLRVGCMVALLAGVALVRGRPRLAAAVIVLVGLAAVSSQLLKKLLAYPPFDGIFDGAHIAQAAFPSGHATAAMSIAIAAVLVVPSRARPLTAVLGIALAVAVGLSLVNVGAHFPSDVVGGFLLAAFWMLVVTAALAAAAARWPEQRGRTKLAAALHQAADRTTTVGTAVLGAAVLAATALAGAALLLTRFADLADFAQEHTSLVAVAGLIAVAGAAVVGFVTVALLRS